jgi:hypothetical protein
MILGEFFILRNNRAKKKRGIGVAKKRGCGVVICRYKKVVFFSIPQSPIISVWGEKEGSKVGEEEKERKKKQFKKRSAEHFFQFA